MAGQPSGIDTNKCSRRKVTDPTERDHSRAVPAAAELSSAPHSLPPTPTAVPRDPEAVSQGMGRVQAAPAMSPFGMAHAPELDHSGRFVGGRHPWDPLGRP